MSKIDYSHTRSKISPLWSIIITAGLSLCSIFALHALFQMPNLPTIIVNDIEYVKDGPDYEEALFSGQLITGVLAAIFGGFGCLFLRNTILDRVKPKPLPSADE